MTHRKVTTTIAAGIAALTVGGVAYAASEQAQLIPNGAPSGYLAINPQTCKFIHPEIDVKPSPGERYARAEDSRDDAKLSCLTRKINQPKTTPDVDGVAGYTQVSASGTGQTVTAQCPAGDVVLGGGSPDEVTGSYPSTASAWTVVRDHLSPARMTAIATCGKAAS